MIGQRTMEGLEVELRPHGWGRYVSALFLAVWLCGWLAGEAFVLWILYTGIVALWTGRPPSSGGDVLETGPALGIGAFLIFWLALWTFGGLAAVHELLRLLWARDRLVASGGRLTVVRLVGPIRSTREFTRESMHRIGVAQYRDALTLWTATGNIELSTLGTKAQREGAAEALRAELALRPVSDERELPILPPGWDEVRTPEGERALVRSLSRRRVQAQIASTVALALAILAFWILQKASGQREALIVVAVLVALAALVGWGAFRLHRGRSEWILASRRLRLQNRFGSTVHQVFDASSLEITETTDSDGDRRYGLDALAPTDLSIAKRRTLLTSLHDPTEPRQLGAWLARATGLPLVDHAAVQRPPVDLAALRTQLEQSGRFGRALARGIAWFEQRNRRIR